MKSQSASHFVEIAKVLGPHGLDGSLRVLQFAGGEELFTAGQKLYLGEQRLLVTIEKVRLIKDHSKAGSKLAWKVKFQEIKDRTGSEAVGKPILSVPESLFQSPKGERLYLRELLNFKVLDGRTDRLVGLVVGLSSNGPQDLLEVETESGSRILIPLVEQYSPKFDFEGQQLTLNLPEGLIEVNE